MADRKPGVYHGDTRRALLINYLKLNQAQLIQPSLISPGYAADPHQYL